MALMASNPPGTDARTGERILYLLKTKGPQAASALAQRLHLTAMAVRQHLYRFREEGLVKFSNERRPVGRPAQIWRLTERAATRFPESHAELTLEMISAIRAAFGEEGLNRLLKERTRRQLRDYGEKMRGAGSGLLERVRALSEIRSAQGYMSECTARPDGTIILAENHCPICVAAESCQGLCREELSLFREVLGKRTSVERIDHILAGARRCAYVICPVPSTASNHSGTKTPGQD
ncbi:MAG TPA: metalloregulator ArsR/SmtB family transcription factor [Candidatus Binataceae bacterium]|nr:metalloregulator ArsR/SmtB family transcription factor [Candidatus Binataceae bacterium]